MQKLFSGVLKSTKTKRGKVIIAAFAIIFIVSSIGLGQISIGSNGNDKATKASRSDEAKLKKLIEDNKEKYYPKTDWLEKHPGTDIQLSSKGAIILDYDTREVLLDNNMHGQYPTASIIKVLTALIAMENYDKSKLCTVSQEAADQEAYKIVMQPGEQLTVEDLLYGMLMLSANDAAETLAECDSGGRSAFLEKMNRKAQELGLTNSHFATPNGLEDTGHYSSAFDMATITEYAIRTQPDFLKYMGRVDDYSVAATDHNEAHYYYQLSSLLKTFNGMEGAKTGFTYGAGNTYIGVASREGRRIIIVYLGAISTTYDATTMLEQGFFLNPSDN